MPECTFTPPASNKIFYKWAIGSASGTQVAAGEMYTFTENTTVYALWKDVYTITFDANEGSGSQSSMTQIQGASTTMPQCTFTAPEGKLFDKWAIGSIGGTQVRAGGTYAFTENTTVYALWKEIPIETCKCLCFTAEEDTSVVGIYKHGTPISEDFKVSTDGITWTQITLPYGIVLNNEGDKIYIKGNNPLGLNNNISSDEPMSYTNYIRFVPFNGVVSASGNIMSIIDDGACNTTVIPGDFCFSMLFNNFDNFPGKLITPPELPATTLTQGCYSGMFYFCDSLTTAPVLPATTLANNCYSTMFYGCESLTVVPELLAITLAKSCYSNMFARCTGLQISDTQTTEAQYAWKIPGSGTFTNTYSQNRMFDSCAGTRASDNMAGEAGQSYTYYTQNKPIALVCKSLCFTANIANSKIALEEHLYDDDAESINLQTSTDGINWTTFTPETIITLANVGDKVYFKGNNPGGVGTLNRDENFQMLGSISASGNIMSLIDDGQCTCTTVPDDEYCFYRLFYRCSQLTTAPELPATTLADSCYYEMFRGCSSLTTAPALPAITIDESCYRNMFYSCTSLTTPPALPATTLAEDCYTGMFYGCTSLIVSDTSGSGYDEAWTIPVSEVFTNTEDQYNMFKNCAGTRSSNDMSGETGRSYTYYTQNPPV